jgi:hypothetical protein
MSVKLASVLRMPITIERITDKCVLVKTLSFFVRVFAVASGIGMKWLPKEEG